MRRTIFGAGEDARTSLAGWSTMLVEAVIIRSRKGKATSSLFPPEVAGVRVDLADIVADARMEIWSTVGVLKLQDVVLEISVGTADFKGYTIILYCSILLGMRSAIGSERLDGVTACGMGAVGLEAALKNHGIGACVANMSMAYTGSLHVVNGSISATSSRPFVVEEDLVVGGVVGRKSHCWQG